MIPAAARSVCLPRNVIIYIFFREIVPARNVCLPRELSDSAAQIGRGHLETSKTDYGLFSS